MLTYTEKLFWPKKLRPPAEQRFAGPIHTYSLQDASRRSNTGHVHHAKNQQKKALRKNKLAGKSTQRKPKIKQINLGEVEALMASGKLDLCSGRLDQHDAARGCKPEGWIWPPEGWIKAQEGWIHANGTNR